MPKRTDINSILIIGSGPIVIGQACEFDYSGTQACKALKEEGYRVILVNSNPATIMTDPEFADRTYIEPLTPEFVEQIIARERPDALLPTMGGQTALNLAMALGSAGVLEKYGVRLIGANLDAIRKAEDRALFKEAMQKIGLDVPRSALVHTPDEAAQVMADVGLPAIIRPAFTLGGHGGNIATTRDEYEQFVAWGLAQSPVHQVLVEASVIGWKEFELEVMRDSKDNVVIICSIENLDPMGIHTGDSITVAPAQTLTDKEYQRLRNAAIRIIREIGVDTGGSNIQFAVNPKDGEMMVIEMNPRVSRSSALASKATGYPIAKIAAKLAVGYTLDELPNDITRETTAAFEPTIDYVVTKIPRFTFEKFPHTEPRLTTQMKSVGEVMAIGATFGESLLKAIRSLEIGRHDLLLPSPHLWGEGQGEGRTEWLESCIRTPTPDRLWWLAEGLRRGISASRCSELSGIDPWFVEEIRKIVAINNSPLPPLNLRGGERGSYRMVDTCAAEFEAYTPYLYSTTLSPLRGRGEGEGAVSNSLEAPPSTRRKVIILGSGPNRIGQGIEFDYCCVQAVFACKEEGFETIMINCNPETVSTDYDTADRLYFEPLIFEDVMNIVRRENPEGVMIQFGGQTPLKLAKPLAAAGVRIFGTSPEDIDRAEDRSLFRELIEELGLKQPSCGIARTIDSYGRARGNLSSEHSEREGGAQQALPVGGATRAPVEDARTVASSIGYPVMVRPSYVLGGRAMEVIYDEKGLERYLREAVRASPDHPVLIDRFLDGAIEVDVDALSDGTDVAIVGIMEHIEEAGVHSGDSSCCIPPHSLSADIITEIERQTIVLAKALHVVGLINVQFAVRHHENSPAMVYILEANPRASRTVPFVAKATGVPVAKIAAKLMVGRKLRDSGVNPQSPPLTRRRTGAICNPQSPCYAVKTPVFPFTKFPGVDTILGPEMKSTGEVMGIAQTFGGAFAKAQEAAGNALPAKGCVFISVRDEDKPGVAEIARALSELGFTIGATAGTHAYLRKHGVEAAFVRKVAEGSPHVVDGLKEGLFALVINTTAPRPAVISDSFSIRRTTVECNIPYFTTISAAEAAVAAIGEMRARRMEVKSLQEWHNNG